MVKPGGTAKNAKPMPPSPEWTPAHAINRPAEFASRFWCSLEWYDDAMEANATTTDPPVLLVPKRSRWFWFRIAVSVFFGLLAVAMCVLWVRSYWRLDVLDASSPVNEYWVALSARGYFVCELPELKYLENSDWRIETHSPKTEYTSFMPRFSFYVGQRGMSIGMPHAIPAVVFAAISTSKWLQCCRFSFSLRTMLLATTLVAIVLGFSAWATR